jgi:hypothetical protein
MYQHPKLERCEATNCVSGSYLEKGGKQEQYFAFDVFPLKGMCLVII